MNDDRAGGIALIAASVALGTTMAFHPTGRELFGPDFETAELRVVWTHALGLAALPLWFLGGLALSRRLASARRLAVAALAVWGFALVAVMVAGTASGLMAPAAAELVREAAPGAEEIAARQGYHLVGTVNQAFASVFVVASAVAIGLWSAGVSRSRALARGVGILGLVVAPLVLVGFLSGHVGLDVHGFGVLMLLEIAWFVAVGVAMVRRPLDP